jgi:hypothetical protein
VNDEGTLDAGLLVVCFVVVVVVGGVVPGDL